MWYLGNKATSTLHSKHLVGFLMCVLFVVLTASAYTNLLPVGTAYDFEPSLAEGFVFTLLIKWMLSYIIADSTTAFENPKTANTSS